MENLYIVMVKMGILVPCSMVNIRFTILILGNLDFGQGQGRNFYSMTRVILKIWPWSW